MLFFFIFCFIYVIYICFMIIGLLNLVTLFLLLQPYIIRQVNFLLIIKLTTAYQVHSIAHLLST